MPAPSATQAGTPPPEEAVATDQFGFGDETATTGPDFNEDPRGDNQEYYNEEFGAETPWQEYVEYRMFREVPALAEAFGENPDTYSQALRIAFPDILWQVQQDLAEMGTLPPGYLQSPEGLEYIYRTAYSQARALDGRLPARPGMPTATSTGTGPTGPRRATAAEIRANFDIDQLSSQVSDIFRGTLLDEAKDPRGIASAYVEAIVANPEQKLDFQTFVEKQAQATPRYASLYRNKPPGISDAQYMMPYLQQAMQYARPNEATGIAAGGAQLGADPNAFRSRLSRTNAVQTSAPFIAGLESRMTSLNKVLKG